MPQIVLITGASSGIGEELAKLFARDGYRLVLVARRKNRLLDLAVQLKKEYEAEIMVLPLDLSVLDGVDQLCRWLAENGIEIDILVNNAGFGVFGLFLSTSWEEEAQMIQLNIVGLTALTKRLLPVMVKKGNGRILFVASTGSFQPGGPYLSVYYATKAYVLSFSEALSSELEGTGVSVTALCPGPTSTEFEKRAGFRQTKAFQRVLMNPGQVARLAYEGLLSGKSLIIPGLQNKLSTFGVRFLPRKWTTRMIRKLQSQRLKDEE
ncbi:SDR family NAD(P)-dependent oxidoreductase [Ammoniphilus resinae]|uniref:Short-subunit dehydrogenase n=1 Tax=Ammoniphilus resinae TaxID=861532 RepID=A0ABS4GLB6_9BACL|nr:SDR family oxidoreductase [Ammoniphilus resinae]MBP1931041.1 short-subunit dehydrogenase [Ammoniphilus resinae]